MNKWFEEFKLEEHALYKVKVKINENNVEHESFLFTGFNTGSYSTIYNNSYEQPVELKNIYSLEIIKQLN